MVIRQPIVSVLGHVDHGKTSLLDKIRGTTVVEREAGQVTQHIGATEVPLETIYSLCGSLFTKKKFKIPGLLFIDTPGHHSFVTLRARGGALADLAILVVDAIEGFKPQTVESLNILRRYKTPFVVAMNKIDLIEGWHANVNHSFVQSFQLQREDVQNAVNTRIYDLVGRLYEHNFSADRYDKITDFQKNIAIVPISAKTGEGIPDLLLVLIGLAQRFLEEQLRIEEGAAEGTILEVKEEKGLGKTIDVIIYKGTIKKGDTVVLGSSAKPIVTKVKTLLKPKPLDEIRSPESRFMAVKNVTAAAGIKISAQELDNVIAGAPLRVAHKEIEKLIAQIDEESQLKIETAPDGVIIKADAIGSLEALAFECKTLSIPIKKAEVGDISRRDVVEAQTISDSLRKTILGFNVSVLPDAKEELTKSDVKLLMNDVVYRLLEDYQEWYNKKRAEIEIERRLAIIHPAKLKILPGCVFRISKPAIVGVRVLAGRIRQSLPLIKEDGKVVGKIKSIQSQKESLKEAIAGQEVAIAIEEATVGRQINVDDILYIDIPENDFKRLTELSLNFDEKEVLEKVCELKRKEKPFWGL